MAGHAAHSETTHEREPLQLANGGRPLSNIALIVGAVGLVLAFAVAYFSELGMRRFLFAYTVAFAFFLALSLGSLFFVLIQHLTRAGWSVNVRRVAESMSSNLVVLAALAVPLLISVWSNNGYLYRWAQPIPAEAANRHGGAEAKGAEKSAEKLPAESTPPDTAHPKVAEAEARKPQGDQAGGAESHGGDAHLAGKIESASELGEVPEVHPSANGIQPLDELTLHKRGWLNPAFFTVRLIVYFTIWIGIALFYRRQSLKQDESGDIALTLRMQALSAPCILAFALSFTFGAFDMVMSLDPHWFSTMFGVYYFAGAMLSQYAMMILIVAVLQRNGYLTQSITKEHFHDLGKWLFAFTFFWGYIGFSQFMLYWYASIPEEIAWMARRGETTRIVDSSNWGYVSILLLVGHLLIPFPGLLSRHIKRRRPLLVFWACWILVFHYVDMYWLVMPELNGKIYFGIPEIAAFVGVGGLVVAGIVRRLGSAPIRPVHDPRLFESMALQNI